jgi:hypothetical protein
MGMAFMVESPEQWNKLSQLVETITGNDLSSTEQAWANPGEGAPHMQAALQHLQQAQEELREAMYDKGVHRAKALQLAENAINEVKKGMEAGNRCIGTIDAVSIGNGVERRDKLFDQWLMTGL